MSLLGWVIAPLVLVAAWRWWWPSPGARRPLPPAPDPDRTPVVALIRIPIALDALERLERFEAPLELALQDLGLGTVTDSGSPSEGTVSWSRIDLELRDPRRAVPLVLDVLRAGGAPPETTVSWTTAQGTREEVVGATA